MPFFGNKVRIMTPTQKRHGAVRKNSKSRRSRQIQFVDSDRMAKTREKKLKRPLGAAAAMVEPLQKESHIPAQLVGTCGDKAQIERSLEFPRTPPSADAIRPPEAEYSDPELPDPAKILARLYAAFFGHLISHPENAKGLKDLDSGTKPIGPPDTALRCEQGCGAAFREDALMRNMNSDAGFRRLDDSELVGPGCDIGKETGVLNWASIGL